MSAIAKQKLSKSESAAIAEGRKTRVRRAVEPSPSPQATRFTQFAGTFWKEWRGDAPTIDEYRCPFGNVGDRLTSDGLTLEVNSIRVERLQEISEADAIAEGVRELRDGSGTYAGREGPRNLVTPWLTAKEAFADLWDTINAKRGYSWESNPWVWVIEFKKVS